MVQEVGRCDGTGGRNPFGEPETSTVVGAWRKMESSS